MDANEELRKLYNKVLASLGSKQEILNQLDKLVKETAEKVNDAQKNLNPLRNWLKRSRKT